MTGELRTRIAAVLLLHQWRATVRMTDDDPVLDCTCGMAFGPHREAHGNTFDCYREHVADAVIADLPELGRIANVAEVCMASLDLDSRSGTALSDRQWLAETILNVLNGAVDE